MSLKIVILAAGQGTRMRSTLPKVLHQLAGRPLLRWILNAVDALAAAELFVVYGHQGEQVQQAFTDTVVTWVKQTEQLGTGHAVQQVISQLSDDDQLLILPGDIPLINSETLSQLIAQTAADEVSILTANVDEPHGLGRILRNKQQAIMGIVEERDANDDEKMITEINTGVMLLPAKSLKKWLTKLSNNNAQHEYYLTDVIALAVADKATIKSSQPSFNEEIMGINDRSQLARLERIYQTFVAETLMFEGVTLRDPTRFDLRGELAVDEDVTIDINVVIEGHVEIGGNTQIGANVILKNVIIGEGVTILPNCTLEDTHVGNDCIIGPFARLRPGTQLANQVKIGNFVEVKKSTIAEGAKLPHLSYVGDAEVGKHVNIGAGVITCNYDGVKKYKTIIGDNAFIGAASQLIAPVKIGKGAYIGTGSSISKDAPAGKLTIARVRQKTIDHWLPPQKKTRK